LLRRFAYRAVFACTEHDTAIVAAVQQHETSVTRAARSRLRGRHRGWPLAAGRASLLAAARYQVNIGDHRCCVRSRTGIFAAVV